MDTLFSDRTRIIPGVVWFRPGRAGYVSDVGAVRPTEEHAIVHAGHEAPAAATVLESAVFRTSAGALLVRKHDGNSAKGLGVTDAVVVVSTIAVILFNHTPVRM